jgi:signal transduction histidine kinase
VPLAALTAAAERIARGDLERPVPSLGDDEIGRLASAFEQMRLSLRGMVAEIERTNTSLEQTVEDRTRELRRLYAELQRRQESRGQLLQKVIAAQEDERRRIARELHDQTCQTLAALLVCLDVNHPGAAAALQRRARDASDLAERALDELHRLILDLRPSILDDLGLVAAVHWFADRHLGAAGIAVRCEFDGLDERLPPEVETTVFRVLQEALTNVERHAHAERVLVQVSRHDGVLAVEVEDDGQGFDPHQARPTATSLAGIGLLGMRERVELMGGTLTVESAPGAGTRVLISIPVAETSNVQNTSAAG